VEERGEVRNYSKLSILLVNNYFPPEIGAASHLYYYLAKELIARGHEVTVLTGIPRYNVSREFYQDYLRKLKGKSMLEENYEGIKVVRVKLPYIERRNIIRRGVEHFEIAWKLYRNFAKLLDRGSYRVDVSLVYSPPLTLYWTAEKIRQKTGSPYVLNVQDLFPQAVIDLGIMRNKILIKFFRKLEKKAYESADLIVTHSERNRKFVASIVEDESKTLFIENWVDAEEIIPGSKKNEFSEKYNLIDKFVVSFAGTLGFSQDMEVILRAAERLKNYKDIIFVIVGDGVRFEEIKKAILERKLENVLLMGAVPKEKYPLILHSSNVSLVTLTKDVKTPVIPSKILSIMSAGIPVVGAMNLDGDAPELVKRAKAGFVVAAGDYEALAQKILLLYRDEALRKELGRNGRRYIEEHLSAKKAAEKWENIFYELLYKKGR
jgi:glycosyltransferase involved in cell wall biosynthesis